jgi:hypothetical protein
MNKLAYNIGTAFWAALLLPQTMAALTIPFLLLNLLFAFTGCTTLSPTASASAKVTQVAADLPTAVSLAAGLVLTHNPKYAPDVLLLGQTLPGLLANGPITPSSYTAALGTIPGITAQEQTDLGIAGPLLNAAVVVYEDWSGKTIVLYTDPNVKALVDAFAVGLVQAAKAVPTT